MISSVIFPLLIVLNTATAAPQKLKLQPELDAVDVDVYIKNPRLFAIQVKCVVYDGPCDAVGRFLKPRVARALLGQCEFCTPKQAKDINKILMFIQDEKPELYREILAKYISDAGIKIPTDSEKTGSENIENKQVDSANELVGKDTVNVPVVGASPSSAPGAN